MTLGLINSDNYTHTGTFPPFTRSLARCAAAAALSVVTQTVPTFPVRPNHLVDLQNCSKSGSFSNSALLNLWLLSRDWTGFDIWRRDSRLRTGENLRRNQSCQIWKQRLVIIQPVTQVLLISGELKPSERKTAFKQVRNITPSPNESALQDIKKWGKCNFDRHLK